MLHEWRTGVRTKRYDSKEESLSPLPFLCTTMVPGTTGNGNPQWGSAGALFSSVQTLTVLPACDGHAEQPARAGTFALLTQSLSSGQGCSAKSTAHTELSPGVSTNTWCTLCQSRAALLKVSLVERRGISLPILCLPCRLAFTCLYKTMFLVSLWVQKVTLWSQIR